MHPWQACIDRAREKDTDFVELCGASTMALKVSKFVVSK